MNQQNFENEISISNYACKTGIQISILIRAMLTTRTPIFAANQELGIFQRVDEDSLALGFIGNEFQKCAPIFAQPANVEARVLGGGVSRLKFRDQYFTKLQDDGTYEYVFASKSAPLNADQLILCPRSIVAALRIINPKMKGELYFSESEPAIFFRGNYFLLNRAQYELIKSIHELTINKRNYWVSLEEIRSHISPAKVAPETYKRSMPNLLRFSKDNSPLKILIEQDPNGRGWRLSAYQAA